MAATKVQKFTTRAGGYQADRTSVPVVNHFMAENHQMACFFRRPQW